MYLDFNLNYFNADASVFSADIHTIKFIPSITIMVTFFLCVLQYYLCKCIIILYANLRYIQDRQNKQKNKYNTFVNHKFTVSARVNTFTIFRNFEI